MFFLFLFFFAIVGFDVFFFCFLLSVIECEKFRINLCDKELLVCYQKKDVKTKKLQKKTIFRLMATVMWVAVDIGLKNIMLKLNKMLNKMFA